LPVLTIRGASKNTLFPVVYPLLEDYHVALLEDGSADLFPVSPDTVPCDVDAWQFFFGPGEGEEEVCRSQVRAVGRMPDGPDPLGGQVNNKVLSFLPLGENWNRLLNVVVLKEQLLARAAIDELDK